MAERIYLSSPCHSLRGPLLYHCPLKPSKDPIRQLRMSGNDAVCAAGERPTTDEMDPSYPLGSAAIRVL
jgi:hypothetical protein